MGLAVAAEADAAVECPFLVADVRSAAGAEEAAASIALIVNANDLRNASSDTAEVSEAGVEAEIRTSASLPSNFNFVYT